MNAERRLSTSGRSGLTRGRLQTALASLLLVGPTRLAAQTTGVPADALDNTADEDLRTVRASTDPSRWLPGGIPASSGPHHAAGFGWGGFDAATRRPLLGANVEASVGTRLTIGAAVNYVTAANARPDEARPSVIARVQVLDQGRHGLDMGIAVGYGRDRFVEEQGMFQASLAGGWRSDRVTLLTNVGYGQDGEGDDHEGDFRLAGLYRARGGFHLGLDGRVRKLLTSSDPNFAAHGTPSLELTAGPVAALTTGSWAFLLETGVSAVRRGTLQTGAVLVGGVGAVF